LNGNAPLSADRYQYWRINEQAKALKHQCVMWNIHKKGEELKSKQKKEKKVKLEKLKRKSTNWNRKIQN
jgi:hypothetical protein